MYRFLWKVIPWRGSKLYPHCIYNQVKKKFFFNALLCGTQAGVNDLYDDKLHFTHTLVHDMNRKHLWNSATWSEWSPEFILFPACYRCMKNFSNFSPTVMHARSSWLSELTFTLPVSLRVKQLIVALSVAEWTYLWSNFFLCFVHGWVSSHLLV